MELLHCSVFLPIDKPGTNDSWFILQQIHRGMRVIKVSSCDHSPCWTEGYGPCGLQQPRDMPKPNCYPGLHRVIWIQDFMYFLRTLSQFELSDLKQSAWACCTWGGWCAVPAAVGAEVWFQQWQLQSVILQGPVLQLHLCLSQSGPQLSK